MSPPTAPFTATVRLACTVSAAVLLLAGCGSDPADVSPAPDSSRTAAAGSAEGTEPHGYVPGAEEAAEPQARLTAVGPGGEITVTDPVSGTVSPVGTFPGTSAATGTDRFVFLSNPQEGTVRIVDSGGWTVPHGDHKHYYSADPGDVGSLTGDRPGAIAGNNGQTAVFFGDGTVTAVDHDDLAEGTVDPVSFKVTAHRGAAVPFEGSYLVSQAEPGAELASAVGLYSPDGRELPLPGAGCPELEGHAVTRTGVVFGCADGALLVTAEAGRITATHLPYPAAGLPAGADRARAFDARSGSDELAAVAGTAGAWHLDTAAGTWRLLATEEPLAAAAAAGDGARVLALGVSGSLLSLTVADGALEASAPLAGPPAAGSAPALEIDPERAYVLNEAGTVLEIDYADGLRTARELGTGLSARLLVETGR